MMEPSPAAGEPDLPLVSCIMPTADRRGFVPHAIRYFLAQDYPNKELVILDDGSDCIADLVPDDPRVRYIRRSGRMPLGAKRNECVRACHGELIMHWDDDDWMAPRRIRCQVSRPSRPARIRASSGIGAAHAWPYPTITRSMWP
jgi:glycosyltransferase involved in cell wall biosynthesis